MDSRYAQKVIDIAKGELGKVSDQNIVYDGGKPTELRYGWENLKKYFDEAGRFTDAHWKNKGMIGDKEINNLDAIKTRNKRLPQKNQDGNGKVTWSGTQWCGIFATWCWVQASIPQVYWGFPGVKGPNVRYVPDFSNRKNKDEPPLTLSDLGLGDIAILSDEDPNNRLVHHCIVTKLIGNDFECVNGNSDYQGVLLKTIPRRRVAGFYTFYANDFRFFNTLKDMYGTKSE